MKQKSVGVLIALLFGIQLLSCRDGIRVIEYGEPVPANKVIGTAATKTQFSTVMALLNRPDYADLLSKLNSVNFFGLPTSEKYTLFLPNNQAFDHLSEQERKALLADTSRLRKVLQYHIVTHNLKLSQLLGLKQIETLADNRLIYFHADAQGKIKVNDASIVTSDILATNGTIFEIDELLTPDVYKPAPEVAVMPLASPSVP